MSDAIVVRAHLRNYPDSSAAFVAYMTGLPAAHAIAALNQLIEQGEATCATHFAPLPGNELEIAHIVYRLQPEGIGTCEICGATDHHLIGGLCLTCRPRVAEWNPAGEVLFP